MRTRRPDGMMTRILMGYTRGIWGNAAPPAHGPAAVEQARVYTGVGRAEQHAKWRVHRGTKTRGRRITLSAHDVYLGGVRRPSGNVIAFCRG